MSTIFTRLIYSYCWTLPSEILILLFPMQRLTFACAARIMRSNKRPGKILPAHMEPQMRRQQDTAIKHISLFLFSFVLTAARRKTCGPPSYAKKPLKQQVRLPFLQHACTLAQSPVFGLLQAWMTIVQKTGCRGILFPVCGQLAREIVFWQNR